jgi:hypothetical protein
LISLLVHLRDAILALALGWAGVSYQADHAGQAAGGCSMGAAGASCPDSSPGWRSGSCTAK